ncbi:ABC transporter ATP-binding protein [Chlorobium limicola]|uniref:ABC transporter n=1 Tax=Chlorobium limicola TaxID=1092 RepID=A0A124GAP1_CHLLI|nr:ABC transporter ATP-binding protein [Chlorobium limicola]KUL32845.1 ABC transporter [Chlorobium limicola]
MKEPIIARLDGISRYYGSGAGQVNALENITLSFDKGAMTALAGPSGSGKSTLLHILGCIDKPDKGTVLIDGIDTTPLSLEQLSSLRLEKIGFVFQSFNLIPVLTAYENVELPLLFKELPKQLIAEKVQEVLAKVGLLERKNHYPRQLSGGQQQRVAIARALVGNPSMILADEPTANLDSNTGKSILDLLFSLNDRESITTVIASHDPAVLERVGKVVRIRDGRIFPD